MTSKQYNEDSLESLGILGGVRARPASIGLESHNHTFHEILGNSIDEANAGFGKEIIIHKNEDGSVTVRDFGRGVPMAQNSNGEYAYQKVFLELWSGGKYRNNEEDGGNYQYSLGTNGLGAAGTNFTSDFFSVYSFKPEGKYFVRFEKGVESADGLSFNDEPNNPSTIGTEITWRPSAECFRGRGEIDNDFIMTTLQDQAIVNAGLKFVFHVGDEVHTYYYEGGAKEYLQSLSPDRPLLTDITSLSVERKGQYTYQGSDNEEIVTDYKIKADIFFAFDRELSFKRLYHNTSWLENGGTPDEFIKNSFTYIIDKYLKDAGLYNKGEKKVTYDDVSDSLLIISSTYSTISLFTDQTKKKIGSDFMKISVTEWLREQLTVYFTENPLEAEKIARQILLNKRSRESAEETRSKTKKKLEEGITITTRPEKFVPCRTNDKTLAQLYLLEGDSAVFTAKAARDPKIQAINPLKGKSISVYKQKIEKVLDNEEVINLYKILGCGMELPKGFKGIPKFDIDNLQFAEINILTDQDEDGLHIRTLLIALFWRLSPQLIIQRKINIIESPLYRIKTKKQTYLAYSEQEKNALIKTLSEKYTINRFKGIGELDAKLLNETAMNVKTRRITPVTIEDVAGAEDMIRICFESDPVPRKKLIEEFGDQYFDFEVFNV